MQQPFSVPDDYDGEGDAHIEPEPPRPTPEQIAEQSALEVFPGGAAALESDEWWQSTEPDAGTETVREPLELPPRPEPSNDQTGAEELDDTIPVDSPTRLLWSEPEPSGAPPSGAYEIQNGPVDPPPAAPDVAPMPISSPPEAVHSDHSVAEELPRSALELPLLSGREQRSAAGASQRAAIMAQAGAAPDPEPAEMSGTDAQAQLAVAMGGTKSAPVAAPSDRRTLTRKIALSLLVIALALVALSGGAIATGQGAEVERVAASLSPDVLERWISDQVSSFGAASPAPTADAPPIEPEATALFGQIAHTGGGGVPVRSTCVPEARTPRTITEGAPVTVIAEGVGDCSGWSVVRAGAVVSWVEAAYLEPVSP